MTFKERLFGIKPKNNNKIGVSGVSHSIVPSVYIDGKKISEVKWDAHLFKNKKQIQVKK
jgi:hypothetical protein